MAQKYGAKVVLLHVLLSDASPSQLLMLSEGLDIADAVKEELRRLEEVPEDSALIADPYVPIIVPVPIKILQQVGCRPGEDTH